MQKKQKLFTIKGGRYWLWYKKEDLNRIFNKGFTGNNGRNNSKSTGLGLYLVKELCDKLGHKIAVDSEYNQYTKFTITFKCDL